MFEGDPAGGGGAPKTAPPSVVCHMIILDSVLHVIAPSYSRLTPFLQPTTPFLRPPDFPDSPPKILHEKIRKTGLHVIKTESLSCDNKGKPAERFLFFVDENMAWRPFFRKNVHGHIVLFLHETHVIYRQKPCLDCAKTGVPDFFY